MTTPDQIVLDVRFDADGMLDTAHVLRQLESELDGHLKVTDWVDERFLKLDYPHLTSEQCHDVIAMVQSGDYDDDIIDKDARRDYLDGRLAAAGYEAVDDEDEAAAPAP